MFLVLILFICLVFIMVVLTLLKKLTLFPKVDSFGSVDTPLKDEDASSRVYDIYDRVEQTDTLELELQNNLRLLEYLMTMELNLNSAAFKSIEDVKRFKDYQSLKSDVEKRILNIVNVKDASTD